ncbi:MAG: DNA primase [Opitutales bacterium]
MAQISRKCIEDIKQRVNLADVVAPYVNLKRSGSSFKGLSPFNAEKTPSFYVHPDRGFFKCFSSGEGGDLFAFIQKVENLEFPEAVEFIANRFSIPLQYESGGPERSAEAVSLRKQLFTLHEQVAGYYRSCFLADHDEAERIRHYWLEERGFDRETADTFGIGYAPTRTDALGRFLERHEPTREGLEASGLFVRLGRGNDPLDGAVPRFQGRLMIPIRDVQGRVVAFTARQMPWTPESSPAAPAKYVNSPETPIFSKSRILFGLDLARKHLKEGERVVLVEGQLDMIRCWASGLHEVVAPQGTAITPEQLSLIRRYTPMVDVILDGDEAGQRAALRMLPLAFQAGLDCRFLTLEPGEDPDTLIREQGADVLRNRRQQALSAMTFAVRTLMGSHPANLSAGERQRGLEAIYQIVAEVDSEVIRQDYLHQVSRLTGVDPAALHRDFGRRRRQPGPRSGERSETPVDTAGPSLQKLENQLFWLLLHKSAYGKPLAHALNPEWIDRSDTAGTLLMRALTECQADEWRGLDSVDQITETEAERRLVQDMAMTPLNIEDLDLAVQSNVESLRRRFLNQQLKSIQQQLARAGDDPSSARDLLQRRQTLKAELTEPLPPLSPVS